MFRGLFENPLALIVLLVIVLLVFGASRLPALAKSLGKSTKILKDELKDGSKGDAGAASTTTQPGSESSTTSTTSGAGSTDSRSS